MPRINPGLSISESKRDNYGETTLLLHPHECNEGKPTKISEKMEETVEKTREIHQILLEIG